jgi:hypothetical protein
MVGTEGAFVAETSMSKSLTTTMDLNRGEIGAVVCAVAMLHTNEGVLHVPVSLSYEVLTKEKVENYAKYYFFDDSWNGIVASFGISDVNCCVHRALTEICKQHATQKVFRP